MNVFNTFQMNFIKMLYTFIFCLLPILIASQEILKYSIEEKQPINTLIVDFTKELNLPKYSTFKLSELLPIHRNLLYVDSETGHLRTNMILDREEMCSKQQCSCESCEVILQLLIQTSGTSIEKILEIKLKDRNDHVPTFGHESGRHLIHIKENVPLGYRIVLPSATDPDEGTLLTLNIYLVSSTSDEEKNKWNILPLAKTIELYRPSTRNQLFVFLFSRFEQRSILLSDRNLC